MDVQKGVIPVFWSFSPECFNLQSFLMNHTRGTRKSFWAVCFGFLCSDLGDSVGICVIIIPCERFYLRTDVQLYSDNLINDEWWHFLVACFRCSRWERLCDLMNSGFQVWWKQTSGNFIDHLWSCCWGAYLTRQRLLCLNPRKPR